MAGERTISIDLVKRIEEMTINGCSTVEIVKNTKQPLARVNLIRREIGFSTKGEQLPHRPTAWLWNHMTTDAIAEKLGVAKGSCLRLASLLNLGANAADAQHRSNSTVPVTRRRFRQKELAWVAGALKADPIDPEAVMIAGLVGLMPPAPVFRL